MARTWLRTALAAALVALGLAACGSDSQGGGSGSAHSITIWEGYTGTEAKVFAQQVAQYNKAHPGVKVTSLFVNNDNSLEKVLTAVRGGAVPDIAYLYGSWAPNVAQIPQVVNLTRVVQRPGVNWTDFWVGERDVATVKGRVIGIPALVDNLALIYNKKLFDQAGLSYPTDQWSWDDFRAAAKKLTNNATKTYGTAYSVSGSEDTTWHLWPLLWQRGGQILDGKKPAFNSDAGVAALETLRQMAVDDKSMYLDQTDEKYAPLFNSGHIGMMLSGPWALLELKEAKLPYGVVDLPGFNGDHQTVSGPDLWALFDHNDVNRAGASRDFVKWLTSAEIDPKWNLSVGNLPLRTTEKDSPEFATYVKDYPGGQKFFDNLANAKQARPTVAGYEELSRNVGDAIAKVLQGQATPKEALNEAAKKSADAVAG